MLFRSIVHGPFSGSGSGHLENSDPSWPESSPGRGCSQVWVENQRAPVVCTPASQRSQCPVQEGSLQFVYHFGKNGCHRWQLGGKGRARPDTCTWDRDAL